MNNFVMRKKNYLRCIEMSSNKILEILVISNSDKEIPKCSKDKMEIQILLHFSIDYLISNNKFKNKVVNRNVSKCLVLIKINKDNSLNKHK